MKCPLLRVAEVVSGKYDLDDKGECLGESCAWWDKLPQRCSVLTLAVGSRIIAGELHHLNEVVHCDVQVRR